MGRILESPKNYPLVRELKKIGVLSDEASPSAQGPYQMASKVFTGRSKGVTVANALDTTAINILGGYLFKTDSTTVSSSTIVNLDSSHISVSGKSVTFTADCTNNNVFLLYSHI